MQSNATAGAAQVAVPGDATTPERPVTARETPDATHTTPQASRLQTACIGLLVGAGLSLLLCIFTVMYHMSRNQKGIWRTPVIILAVFATVGAIIGCFRPDPGKICGFWSVAADGVPARNARRSTAEAGSAGEREALLAANARRIN